MSPEQYREWPVVKFGDVVKNVAETCHDPEAEGLDRYLGLDHLDGGELAIRRWGDLTTDEVSFTRRFHKGQVLFAKRRAYQRKVAVAEFDGICSSDILCFEPKDPKVLLPELLPFIVQSDGFFEHALGTSAGSLSPRTRWSQLKTFEFPLPPLDEQKRLAELLWAAAESIRGWESAENELATVAECCLSSFLRGGGTENLEDTEAGPIPTHWVAAPCAKLFSRPPRNGLSPKSNAAGRGFPTLSIGAVRQGRVEPEGNLKFAEISREDLDKYRLHRGDLLVVRGNGNRDLCGRCGMVGDVPDDCFYPDLLIRISFDEEQILPEFACLQWNSKRTHRRLLSRAKSTNGIWKVNGKDLKQHVLAVPPLNEQKRFLEGIAHPQQAAREMAEHLANSRALQQQLVNHLVGGNHD